MKRRDFITTTALSSLFFSTTGFFSACTFSPVEAKERNLIDPLIPFQYHPELEKEMISYIIELNKHYGLRRFLLTGPSKEFRYTGFPQKEVFSDLGEQILNVKKQLAGYDIEIGWWCVTTIRIGNGKFQNIIRSDGSIA